MPAVTAPTSPRVLVIEDHPVVRAGLVHALGSGPGFIVCGATGEQRAARELARQHQPELVILDLILDGHENLPLIGEILAEVPSTRILVLSMLDETVYAERALRAGALGYVMKSADTDEIILALRNLMEGRIYLGPKIFVSLFRGLIERSPGPTRISLSDRELQIYQLIGAGIPNRDIARKLGISVKTVETHRENIKFKLGLQDAQELSAAAQRYISALRTSHGTAP
ncbi:MAG: response regulator transcription factor [Lacunisphaera sp.]